MSASLLPLRTSLVLPVAAAVTVGLFLMMRGLIDIGDVRPEPVVERPRVQIHFEVPDTPPVRPRPEQPETYTPPPHEWTPIHRSNTGPVADGPRFTVPPIEPTQVGLTAGGLVSPNRAPIPVVRIEPGYPPAAERRGLEGQCTVIFDITPQGTTTNVRTLSCTSTHFERASLNAVSRWRYNPQVRDGEPIMFRGATTQLRYSLGG